MNPTGAACALTSSRKKGARHRNGFSLVEVSIALAIVAVTFLGLIGLLGVGVANDQMSSEQTMATNLVASIVSDLRSTPALYTTGNSARFSLPMSSASAVSTSGAPMTGITPVYIYFDNYENALNATPYTSIPASPPGTAAYLATIYLAKVTTVPQTTYLVRCVVTWPAQTSTHPSGNVDVVTEFLNH